MKNRRVIIKAGGGGPAEPVLSKQSKLTYDVKSNAKGEKPVGFTMAEILLSLTIIGVVAAITLPSLTGNINERTWNTQRKALYARFSQAIALMPALNGYGTLTEDSSSGADDAVDTVAETFVTSGLAKVLKINNICDGEHLEDCGITSKITTSNSVVSFPQNWQELNPLMISASFTQGGTSWSHSMINSKAAAFETQNGESIAVFYNPYCRQEPVILNGYIVPPLVCANFIYDLNGSKGPNTVGKDVGFMTALYSSDSQVVAPVLEHVGSDMVVFADANKYCRTLDNARLPNKEEAIAMFVNKKFYSNLSNFIMTTSSPGLANRIIHIDQNIAMLGVIVKDSATAKPVCIKR